jgi:hypothetical protein
MANISLALYTNVFFGSALKLPIQIGTLSIYNSARNISRLGTFNQQIRTERANSFVVLATNLKLNFKEQKYTDPVAP